MSCASENAKDQIALIFYIFITCVIFCNNVIHNSFHRNDCIQCLNDNIYIYRIFLLTENFFHCCCYIFRDLVRDFFDFLIHRRCSHYRCNYNFYNFVKLFLFFIIVVFAIFFMFAIFFIANEINLFNLLFLIMFFLLKIFKDRFIKE